MTRLSLAEPSTLRASSVPEPVGVKKAPTPTPAARRRSARLPWGTSSSSILPARYSSSNTKESAWRGKLQMILHTRPVLSKAARPLSPLPALLRSEERRGGHEWVSTCRSRGAPYHEKKTTTKKQ